MIQNFMLIETNKSTTKMIYYDDIFKQMINLLMYEL